MIASGWVPSTKPTNNTFLKFYFNKLRTETSIIQKPQFSLLITEEISKCQENRGGKCFKEYEREGELRG